MCVWKDHTAPAEEVRMKHIDFQVTYLGGEGWRQGRERCDLWGREATTSQSIIAWQEANMRKPNKESQSNPT